MKWLRRNPEAAPTARPEAPTLDQHKLTLAAAYLDTMFRPWLLDEDDEHGPLLAGPNASIVFLGSCDESGDPRHVRLVFGIGNDDGTVTYLPDCVQVPGPDVQTAVARGVETWADTTGRAVVETFLGGCGRVGVTLGPEAPDGVPGWCVSSGLIGGWGAGEEHDAQKAWLAAHPPWRQVTPHLTEDLDPARLNGVKIYLAGGGGHEVAEVHLNGELHEPASAALLGADWPRPAAVSVGRTYAVFTRAA